MNSFVQTMYLSHRIILISGRGVHVINARQFYEYIPPLPSHGVVVPRDLTLSTVLSMSPHIKSFLLHQFSPEVVIGKWNVNRACRFRRSMKPSVEPVRLMSVDFSLQLFA